jgi:hypothetical protein
MNTYEPNFLSGISVTKEEDGEDGYRERSSTPEGCRSKIHMQGVKMLETQVGQLVGHPIGNKEEFPRQSQGREKAKATQTHSGDHTKETMKITTEGPEFEMPSHYMKEVVASVKTERQSQPVKTKNMTKPKNKPVPKMVQKWVPKIATPTKSVDPK